MQNLFRIIPLVTLFLFACKEKPNFNVPENIDEVRTMLDSIHDEDQKYRAQISEISEIHGQDSEEMQSLWDKISKIDSTNLLVVKYVIDNYGWLGEDEIGYKANATLFLVIQHADHETQLEYLPVMREAVEQNNAEPWDLALLEDRTALGSRELQIYGSQIGIDNSTGEYYVLPLLEPEKVNERRKEVGLGSIESYLELFDLEWNVDAYKEKLPYWLEIEKRKRR